MGAEVGVRKIEDDEVTEERGAAVSKPSRTAYLIVYVMLVLSAFGVWKLVSLVPV